jgi:hypothetical protein
LSSARLFLAVGFKLSQPELRKQFLQPSIALLVEEPVAVVLAAPVAAGELAAPAVITITTIMVPLLAYPSPVAAEVEEPSMELALFYWACF